MKYFTLILNLFLDFLCSLNYTKIFDHFLSRKVKKLSLSRVTIYINQLIQFQFFNNSTGKSKRVQQIQNLMMEVHHSQITHFQRLRNHRNQAMTISHHTHSSINCHFDANYSVSIATSQTLSCSTEPSTLLRGLKSPNAQHQINLANKMVAGNGHLARNLSYYPSILKELHHKNIKCLPLKNRENQILNEAKGRKIELVPSKRQIIPKITFSFNSPKHSSISIKNTDTGCPKFIKQKSKKSQKQTKTNIQELTGTIFNKKNNDFSLQSRTTQHSNVCFDIQHKKTTKIEVLNLSFELAELLKEDHEECSNDQSSEAVQQLEQLLRQ